MTAGDPAARRDVAISAGHNNFHLLFSAAEMARRGRLAMLMAGAVPTKAELTILESPVFRANSKIRRFLNREEAVPAELIRQSRVSEIVGAAGFVSRRSRWLNRLSEPVQAFAMKLYGRRAVRHVRRAARGGAKIYHFRAGFGASSVVAARELGMRTICDHSIVHPSLLKPLIDNRGKFPDQLSGPPRNMWKLVMQDIEAADEVLLNSDFVAETFAFLGFDRSRIHVAYQGVEDKFLARLPQERSYARAGEQRPLRLLFAGSVTARKGVDVLQDCMSLARDLPVTLDVAGGLSARDAERFASLLKDPRVRYHGLAAQQALATMMSKTDVLVFPTFAEGSARVIFEAMAAGCAVITTPNAGSVLEDGKGGYLIAPGDVAALREALEKVVAAPAKVGEMGRYNYDLVRGRYTQKHYGDQLERVYG